MTEGKWGESWKIPKHQSTPRLESCLSTKCKNMDISFSRSGTSITETENVSETCRDSIWYKIKWTVNFLPEGLTDGSPALYKKMLHNHTPWLHASVPLIEVQASTWPAETRVQGSFPIKFDSGVFLLMFYCWNHIYFLTNT